MTGFLIICIIAALFFYYDRKKRSSGSHENKNWNSHTRRYPKSGKYSENEDEYDEEFEDGFVSPLPDELMNRVVGPALYVDHEGNGGQERPKSFYSKLNNLGARPDYIFQLKGNKVALVELKTGKESEAAIKAAETQAFASALAVNQDRYNLPGVRVTDVILVFNDHIVKEIRLPSDDFDLYRKIKPFLLQAWTVAEGQQPDHYPDPEKCRACNVQRECPIYTHN